MYKQITIKIKDDIYLFKYKSKDMNRVPPLHLRIVFSTSHTHGFYLFCYCCLCFFLSFCCQKEDTRGYFTSHLHAALRRNNLEAINVFLVMFSENYASSSWCLNELMECRKQVEDVDVIPVFYKIHCKLPRRSRKSKVQGRSPCSTQFIWLPFSHI